MVRRPPFQRSFSPKPLGLSKPNFIWSLSEMGERKFVRGVWVTWPRWPPRQYMVKTIKNLHLQNQRANDLVACCVALWPLANHSCSNDDPRFTLTYFTARSNLVFDAFIWGKLLESHLMEEICSKWPEWQKVYVYIKLLTPRGCLPCPRAIHMYKNMKNYV